MRPLGACARADLVRALASGDPQVARITAELLGFAPPAEPLRHRVEGGIGESEDVSSGAATPGATVAPGMLAPADVPFWRVETFAALTPAETEERPVDLGDVIWDNRPAELPRSHLLAPWRELQPRLRREGAQDQETHVLDVGAVVWYLSRGHQMARIPYERRRRWGPRLQIIADRSERLVPYWTDQELTGRAVAALLPAYRVEHAAIWEGLSQPRLLADTAAGRAYRTPPPGTLVLVLGDLGCLADGDTQLHRQWLDFGRRLAEVGCRPVALLPFSPGRCLNDLRDVWRLLPWDRARGSGVADPTQLRQRAERLLCLVSPALRIEPGFLRAVRLLLPASEADAGTESDVWQHPAVVSTSAAGATLEPEAAKRLRAAFAAEPAALQRQVLALLRVWRGPLPQEIWFEEIECLAPGSRALLPEPEDLALARRFSSSSASGCAASAPAMLARGRCPGTGAASVA